jgi:hypothetical protein
MQRFFIRYERGDGDAAFTEVFRTACTTGRPILVELEGQESAALCLVTEANAQGFAARILDASDREARARTHWVERERVVRVYRGPLLNG